MAKGEARGWKKFIPSKELVVRVAVALVVLRLVTRYVILPYQAKLPAVIRDNWPTPA
jgi:hypothetical protein